MQGSRDQVAVHDHRNRKQNSLSYLQGQGHKSSRGAEQPSAHVPAELAEAPNDGQTAERHHHSASHGAVKHQSRRPRQAGREEERSTAGNEEIDLDGVKADAQIHSGEHSRYAPYGCNSCSPPSRTHQAFVAQGPLDSYKAVHSQSGAQEEVHLRRESEDIKWVLAVFMIGESEQGDCRQKVQQEFRSHLCLSQHF